VQEYTIEFRKQSILMGIYPKNSYVLLKYSIGLHSQLKGQVMLFKTRNIDEFFFMKVQYLGMNKNKGKLNGSK
jgi:hypothetical protein